MSTLTCPKCQSAMRSYERSGVTVDRCTECGGLFLDRGEVERLVELEGRMAAEGFERDERGPRRWEGDRWEHDRWRRRDDDDDDDWEDRREGRYGRRGGSRRGGLLGNLLDF
jgi:uncharacterized protein